MTIELHGVAFSYANDATKSLLNIDHWSVAKGERVLVHGPSGSGKSTLLNVMGGLLTCSVGEVVSVDITFEDSGSASNNF